MPEKRETYKGKEIVVRTRVNGPQMTIDQKEVVISYDEHTGRYATHFLPYTDYLSVMNLAKHLIESVPNFGSKSDG